MLGYDALLNGQRLRSVALERDDDGWRVVGAKVNDSYVGYSAHLAPTLRLVGWAIEYAICQAKLREALRSMTYGPDDEDALKLAAKIRELNHHVQGTMGYGCGEPVFSV